MRTRNFFSIAALVICGMVCVTNVKGEGSGATSNPVTVNLKFKPVQSIVVNPDQETVDLVYAKKDDYRDGVSKIMEDHLTVFSTGGFVVSVEALSENFMRIGGTETETETIPLEDVIIRAVNGTNTAEADFSDVELSTNPSTLITSDVGGNELKYSVTYNSAGSGYKYINKYIHPDNPESGSVYTAEVIYTIVTN